MTVAQMINDLIEREGGFVDHPADRGGPTKYGITQKTLDAWHAQGMTQGMTKYVTPIDVRDLDEGDAAIIYQVIYYQEPKINELPKAWQPLVFDWAVNSGPATAIKELQAIFMEFGADPGPVDGIIGPRTVAAARAVLAEPLKRYLAKRRIFCELICASDPSQEVFLRGWISRIDNLEKELG